MLFDRKVAAFHCDCVNYEEVIKLGSSLLLSVGTVKDTYEQNVLDREERFPTGIPTDSIGVALPHTDSEHVNTSQIAFLSLARPVMFRYMADKSTDVPVSLVFMIAMREPHEQVGILKNLMGLLRDRKALAALQACTDKTDLSNMLLAHGIE